MTGRLIVVEGLDGVGKTTLSKMLAARLDARWATTPDPALRAVRDVIDARWAPGERALFYAGAVVQAGRAALADLAEGRDVVVDRYWATTWAYAGASGGAHLDALEPEVVPADVTVWVACDEAERRRRLAQRGVSRLDAEALDHTDAVRRAYEVVLRREVSGRVVAVAADGPVEALVDGLALTLASVPGRGRVRGQLELFEAAAGPP